MFAIEVLEGYSQTSDTQGQTTPQSPPLPVLQVDTPRGGTTSKLQALTNYS